MNELANKFQDIKPISTIPETLRRENVIVNPKECFLNAHRFATANPGMTIIEGVMLGRHKNGAGQFFPHAWNRLGDVYFDITGEMILANSTEINEIVYAPAFEYTTDEFPVGSMFEFQEETIKAAEELNTAMEDSDGKSSQKE